jgi:hypothetical protein
MGPNVVRRGLAALLVLAAAVVAAPTDARAAGLPALPPSSLEVSYSDATVLASCNANGLLGIYFVSGQAAPRLPLMDASVTCSVDGMSTLTAIPTLNGLLGNVVPLLGALQPLLAPQATSTSVGVALALLTEHPTICLTVDTTLTLPVLPPVHNRASRCATG